jgi:YrbI family 3-deoxy-D-manno-octulosonate 8-phosphate phosphatase
METPNNKYLNIKLFLSDVDGVLTDAGMYYTEAGDELKKFSTLDGGGFILLKYAGIKTGLLTTEKTRIVERRSKKLKIDYLIQGASDKLRSFEELLNRSGMEAEEVAYIGDDINDIPVLKRAGVSASVPNHCLPSDVQLDYVTTRPGGGGAVREFAEWLLERRGEYELALSMYLKTRSV